MEKILILKSDRTDFERYFISNMQRDNVTTRPLYKFNHGCGWYIQVLWIEKFNLPFKSIFYGKWKKFVRDYDTVIVFDRNLNWNIIEWIKSQKTEIRCIAWYWNPIQNTDEKSSPPKDCEIWSFDQKDCSKYNYRKNVQFHFRQTEEMADATEYDAFFVGVDKGRYKQVEEIMSQLDQYGLKTFWGVVADKDSVKLRKYIDEISYGQIIELIKKSKCIVDIPQKNQDGITLRVLESIFWSKKLITTYEGIVQYDFYKPNNILIWGQASQIDIKKFFETPYESIERQIVERYSFEQWLENFQKGL